MKLRRLLSCMMALLLVCSLPLSAFAEEYDLSVSSVTVNATDDGNGGTTQTVSQVNGVQNHTETTPTVTIQTITESAPSTTNTTTINAAENATANVTLSSVNIDTGTGDGAAVEIKGNGDVVIELDGSNTVQSGEEHAGVEKNNAGNLTITDENETDGSLQSTGGEYGSGIGGILGTGSDITISEDAQVKVQGGEQVNDSSSYFGVGAAIGNCGKRGNRTDDIAGEEKNPNTDELTPNGKIEYYAPGANMETGAPTKTVTGTYGLSQPTEPVQPAQPEEEAPQIAAPYRVVGQDGKNLACKKAQSSGVLTITVDTDFATLTGSASSLKTLKAQGVETIVFVTTGATSTFALADLLAQLPSGSTYALTHVGSTVTLPLSSGEDISKILK